MEKLIQFAVSVFSAVIQSGKKNLCEKQNNDKKQVDPYVE